MTASANSLGWATFAGRAAELAALRTAVDASVSGQLATVLISGEAGIGKTRLAEAVCQYAREQGFRVLTGHCSDTESTLSYFPFIQAFRQLASGAPAGRTRQAREYRAAAGIAAKLVRKTPSSAVHDSAAGDAQRIHLFDSVVGLLRELAERQPLLMLLEDLHWSDQGSLSLLVHAVNGLTAARVMLIGTYRESDTPRSHPLRAVAAKLGRHQSCHRIRLKGLSTAEAAALLEGLLGPEMADETRRFAANLGRITSGNPLFIHQVVRQLLETGRLFKQHGTWFTASGWESKLAAQDGLLELVDARLSRLSQRCLNALTHAAVLGEQFETEVVARMLKLPERRLMRVFHEAESAKIIVAAAEDEKADYSFVHALVRQSLYERLSRPEKRALHGLAANAIESGQQAGSDSHLTQLALHYAKSGNAADRDKAVDYSIRAGERAFAVCAFADAAFHWHTALRLATASHSSGLRAQLHERLGESSLLSSATPAEAARNFEAALELYGQTGQEQDTVRVHARLVTVLSMTSASIDVGQALSHSRRAEDLLVAKSGSTTEGELLIGEAIVAHAQLRTADGLAASERAMELGQALGNSEMWSQAAALHGHFLWASGKLAAGLALMEQAFQRAEKARGLQPRFAAAWLRGFSYLLLWNPTAAEQSIRLGLADSDGTQAEFLRQILVAHLGVAHILTGALSEARAILALAPHQFLEANLRFLEGEWDQAEKLLSLELERSHGAQSKQLHWTSSLWLARLKRMAGNYARARELLLSTPLLSEGLLRVPEEITTRAELALIYLAEGQAADARAETVRCRALMDTGENWHALSGFVDRAEAAVLAEEGLLDEAGERFAAAGKLFSQYRVPWEVAETLITWAVQLMRAGRVRDALEKLDGAGQIYQHLGLGPRWQSRIEGLRANAAPQPAAIPAPAATVLQPAMPAPADSIYSLVGTNDVALLATLIHDAIAHLMNAIDKASKIRAPIERIADATEKISKLGTPVDRIARVLEQVTRNSAFGPYPAAQRTRSGRSRRPKLDRSHDPGRPL